jgi:hypothetical protein
MGKREREDAMKITTKFAGIRRATKFQAPKSLREGQKAWDKCGALVAKSKLNRDKRIER